MQFFLGASFRKFQINILKGKFYLFSVFLFSQTDIETSVVCIDKEKMWEVACKQNKSLDKNCFTLVK